MQILRNPESVVASLSRSPFRRKFKLSAADRGFVREQGMQEVQAHARLLIVERLAMAEPVNDGRQTPFRGHPVSVAQHGTATCCRRCVEKWHHIPAGRALAAAEQDYVLALIMIWIKLQLRPHSGGRTEASTSAAA